MSEEAKTDTPERGTTPAFTANNFGGAPFRRNEWRMTLTEAHVMADVERPLLWKHILGKIARGDVLEAFKPDTGEYAKFVVTEAGQGFIKLGRIEAFTPAEVAAPEDSALTTKWNVGKRAHDVIRKADGFVMATNFQTKEGAVAWIADHQKKVAA